MAAQTESGSGTKTFSKSFGNGCTLHAIIADAGSRVRGNAWVTCDKQMDQISLRAELEELPNGKPDFILTACHDKYWCGTGDMYAADPAGKQNFAFWVYGMAGDKHLGPTLISSF